MTRHRHADGYRPPRKVDAFVVALVCEIVGILIVFAGGIWIAIHLFGWISR